MKRGRNCRPIPAWLAAGLLLSTLAIGCATDRQPSPSLNVIELPLDSSVSPHAVSAHAVPAPISRASLEPPRPEPQAEPAPQSAGDEGSQLNQVNQVNQVNQLASSRSSPQSGDLAPPVATATSELRLVDNDPVNWWESLADPQLTSLIAETLAANPNAAQAAARFAENQSLLMRSKAEMLPRVGSTMQFDHRQFSQNGNAFVQQSSSTTGFDFYSNGLQSSWELDLWGQLAQRQSAARADLQAAGFDIQDINVSLTAEVVRAFVELCLTNAQIQIAQANADVMQEARDIANIRRQSGSAGELDEKLAASQYRLTIAEMPQLQLQRQQTINRLNALRGQTNTRGDFELTEISRTLSVPPARSPQLGNLTASRPDVRATQSRLQAAAARIGISKKEYLPKVRLQANVSVESREADQLWGDDSVAYGVGPLVQWELLDFGRRRADLRLAEARYRSAKAEYLEVLVRANEEVNNAVAGIELQAERMRLLSEAVADARAITDMALLEYREGLGNFQNVLDAQRQRLSIEAQAATANAATWLAYVQFYRAIGGATAYW